jgi:hypothetical protein
VKLRHFGSLIGVSAPLALILTQGCASSKSGPGVPPPDAAVDRSVDRSVDKSSGQPVVDAAVDPPAPTPDRAMGAPDVRPDVAVDASRPGTPISVVTNRYDNVRNGANLSETTLTVANVGGGGFGLIFSRAVDGQVYAQPLYMPGLVIGGATHNVLFVATEHDTVYAFDADNPAVNDPLWTVTLGTPMDTTPGTENQPVVAPATVSCRDMFPKTGITSTPVIDPATGRMYVVTKNFEGGKYFQRLHALDILTGKDLAGSPVDIAGSVPGTAPDGNGTSVTFDPYHHLNRPGLLLTGGNVYIAFSSHCDDEPYHGWVFAYSRPESCAPRPTAARRRRRLAGPTPVWAVSGSREWDWSPIRATASISWSATVLSTRRTTGSSWASASRASS